MSPSIDTYLTFFIRRPEHTLLPTIILNIMDIHQVKCLECRSGLGHKFLDLYEPSNINYDRTKYIMSEISEIT